ncbi:MAG: aminotransferase class IV [Planctomycetota bacterium]
MPTDHAIVNGELMPLCDARISVLDLGFMRGLAVFETLRTYGGLPHALGAHLERLARSCAGIDIAMPFAESDLRAELERAHRAVGAPELRLNLFATPGTHREGVFGADGPTTVIIAKALSEPPAERYTHGVAVVTFSGQRYAPQIKTTTYITGRRGIAAAARRGAEEALYVDEQGHVSEGVTSNVLALFDRTVISPAHNALQGITREHIKHIVGELGLAWRDGELTPADLHRADELWITSSVRELMPVIRVDDTPIGDGRPGPLAQRIRERYRAACLRDAAADAERSGG